jgi:hypothetical protein
LKHSNTTHLSLHSNSTVTNSFLLRFILTPTGNMIGAEGAVRLSEALKSNSSLTWLNLSSNELVASFHSHSMQIITLEMKELSN